MYHCRLHNETLGVWGVALDYGVDSFPIRNVACRPVRERAQLLEVADEPRVVGQNVVVGAVGECELEVHLLARRIRDEGYDRVEGQRRVVRAGERGRRCGR